MSRTPRPSIWPAIASYIGAIVLVYLVTSALVLGVALSRGGRTPAQVTELAMQFALSAPGIAACAFVSAAILALVTIVGARWQGPSLRERLRLGPTRASRLGILASVLGMAGLSLASAATGAIFGLGREGTMGAIARALERPGIATLVLALATIAVAPALAEEAFFRGLLQTQIAARWGRWPAIVVTAFAFGLAHFDPLQGPVAFVAGLFLGWVVERFDGIRPAVAAHALNNAAFVVLASFGSTGEGSRAEDLGLVGVGSVVCIGAVALLRSRRAVRPAALPPPGPDFA